MASNYIVIKGKLLREEIAAYMQKNTIRCPINNTFQIIGKKFTVLILRNMIYLNQIRFNKLLNSIEGINAKTLSIRLKEMEKDGLIRRKIYNESPIRIEYEMTEKGMALEPILEQMSAFSMKYFPKEIFKNGKPRTYDEVYGYEKNR
ncbi:MAG: helix-turn-helix domain-containing protein [Nitrososphaeraceae archaeon]